MTARTYTAFTDGSCLNNGTIIARAGWAALVRNAEGVTLEAAGPLNDGHHPTNQRAELTAAIEALKIIKKPAVVDLYTDSNYVVQGINSWMTKWKANDWRKSDKKPIENVDLWKVLDTLLGLHSVTAHWIKGHSGHVENDRVDALAAKAAEFQKSHRKLIPAEETSMV
jgi:ribonuclease HI